MHFRGQFVWGKTKSQTDLNQNQLGSSLGLILTNIIKKFQPLTHKTLLGQVCKQNAVRRVEVM